MKNKIYTLLLSLVAMNSYAGTFTDQDSAVRIPGGSTISITAPFTATLDNHLNPEFNNPPAFTIDSFAGVDQVVDVSVDLLFYDLNGNGLTRDANVLPGAELVIDSIRPMNGKNAKASGHLKHSPVIFEMYLNKFTYSTPLTNTPAQELEMSIGDLKKLLAPYGTLTLPSPPQNIIIH